MFLAPRAFAVLLICIASPALAQSDDESSAPDDTPHITMVGTAHAEIAPDIATITLGVTTEKPNAADAANDNARKAQAVVDAAKAEGIKAADIATQSLTLNQTFDEVVDSTGRVTGQRPRGFAAENIVAIKVRDLGKAGTLAQALVTNSANRFDGIAFGIEHPEPIRMRLTGEAVKNAKALAQTAAEAAGTKLGRVLLIAPAGGGGEPMRVSAMRMKRAAPAAPPVEAGTTTLQESMEVTWSLGN